MSAFNGGMDVSAFNGGMDVSAFNGGMDVCPRLTEARMYVRV
jgi:hypothetical protein